MKIIEFHIYGYGQLENLKITNLSDFQVFYGENEAGKSTIMAFIHGILFGFPTKQQSDLRYEPKHSSKYGGKIRIYHEEHGYAVIERIKGKAAGDVKVVMDSGVIGGEELLKELTGNFDKSLYQAIFSFNLQGLQNIHQLKDEDIGKFLFSAGTLGTEQLSKAETFLQRELDLRFKPTGKKPLLNERLQALHEISGELKKAAAKNKEYESLITKNDVLQEEMLAITDALQELAKKMEKLNEWKRIEPIFKEERRIKKELNELGEIRFPARGMERMEKLNQLIHPYQAEIVSISDRIENMKQELTTIEPTISLLENEPAILRLLNQIPIMEQWNLEKQQCEVKLAELEDKLSITREKLHLSLNEDDILAINTNIYMRNQVEIVSRKRQKLEETKVELEAQYQEEKNGLEEIEKDVRFVERQVLAKQERLQLEEQINAANDKKSLEWELNSIQEQIEIFKLANERDKTAKENINKQKRIQFFLFEFILFGLLLYGMFTKQWVLFSFGVLGCIGIALFMMKSTKPIKEEKGKQKLNGLIDKETNLRQKLESAKYLDITKLENQLQLDNQRLDELQLLKMSLKQQQIQYNKALTKWEEWEKESSQNKEQLLSISNELKIPEYIAVMFLQEAFELIEQCKSIYREKKQLQERLGQINQLQDQIEEGLKSYENRFLEVKGLDLHNSAYLLRNKLKEEHEKQIKSQERNGKLADLIADLKQKSQELVLLQSEHDKLLQTANTETELQFYERGEKAEKQAFLLERYNHLLSQLQYATLPEQAWESYLSIHDCDEVIAGLNLEASKFHSKLKELQENQASIKYEIQILEEGGVYSDILHHYKQKKFELEEAAKEWSVYCLSQQILAQTIDKYKNIHLPRMLSKAEEYMSILTDGSYNKIHLQKSGSGFLVEREDHTLFEAKELSQGTMEQLYVSIRLALATTLYEKYQFPIIIDDSFVNFDAKRTNKVIELLKTLERNQLLFFTCHAHLLPLFQRENILSIEKGAIQVIH
ncbi:AAA family ATPase [Neobacillus sp. MM2021_6]|uniref:ATP-binding protein n=1 Tax=Bacillaceae TaxID=186817 RepID=UPI0014076008|nr:MULTISPECIES: AAA family ATPase [Bacillaceae]MBO0961328.1 AAA family ATPase [Neobacillus sp. MM2021_6]NHC18779.1 AAA family ATPase [Bacillus sp. MM2020_4]